MNELHVTSKLLNQKDVLEVLENLADAQDVTQLDEAVEQLYSNKLNGIFVSDSDNVQEKINSSRFIVINYIGCYLFALVGTGEIAGLYIEDQGMSWFTGEYDANTTFTDLFNNGSYLPLAVDSPTAQGDIANKGYVDTAVAGIQTGTKLYLHAVSILDNGTPICGFAIYKFNNQQITYISQAGTNGLSITGDYFLGGDYFTSSDYKLKYARAGVTNVLDSTDTVVDISGYNVSDTVTPL